MEVAEENNLTALKNTKDQIELIISEMDSLNLSFSVNSDSVSVMRRVMTREKYDSNTNAIKKLASSYLTPIIAARRYIHSLYIYMDNPYGRFLTSTDGLLTSENYYDVSWLDSYEQLKQQELPFLSESRTLHRYSFEKQGTEIITLYKRFFMQSGVVVLNLYRSYFDQQLAQRVSSPNQILFVVNSAGQVLMQSRGDIPIETESLIELSSTDRTTLSRYDIEGYDYFVTRIHSAPYGLTYLNVTPLTELYAFPNHIAKIMLLLTLAALLLCFLMSWGYAHNARHNILKIFTLLDHVKTHEDVPYVHVDSRDTYAVIMHNIVEGFSRNFAEHNRLMRQIELQRLEAKELELNMLRAQINPHFLFNTLQSIYWMSVGMTGSPNEVSHMIENMTSILAYGLDTSDKLVPLSKEIEHTKAYIVLQQMRYKDRFQVIWDVSDGLLSYTIIKLLLQPLVENAIMHGMRWETQRMLCVTVRIYVQAEDMHIEVSDDGCGIDTQQLEGIRARLIAQEDGGHIGLFSCNRRLCLTYGAAYALDVASQSGEGTAIHMRLPMTCDWKNVTKK